MDKVYVWLYIIVAVGVALSANSISTIWASQPNKFASIWFIVVILVSPLVFITFGLAVSRLGLAVSAGTIDALLTVSSVLVGLFIFHEYENLSIYQFLGLGCTIIGIVLMQIQK